MLVGVAVDNLVHNGLLQNDMVLIRSAHHRINDVGSTESFSANAVYRVMLALTGWLGTS